MADFNLAELLPFYLDETDENIAALNDALLRLEQDPADAKALAEAFRMFHSIKGASIVMGFESVNRLTHVLESLFDQLRNKKRELDRPILDLTFRCLDELRDYHRELRSEGQSGRDLAGLVSEVDAALTGAPAPSPAPAPPTAPTPEPETAPAPADLEGAARVVVRFEAGLPLADMKARLVAERLAGKGRVVATDPRRASSSSPRPAPRSPCRPSRSRRSRSRPPSSRPRPIPSRPRPPPPPRRRPAPGSGRRWWRRSAWTATASTT